MKKFALSLSVFALMLTGLFSCGSKDPNNMSPEELIERMQELSIEIDQELAAGHQEKAFQLMDELEEVKTTLQNKASQIR